jgi:DHA2 family multidrug resistance protein-like MFS transporter
VAISATAFTALSESNRSIAWIEGMISYLGRQDNLAVRQAAFFALAINLVMVMAAIASIMLTIPKLKRGEQAHASDAQVAVNDLTASAR